MSNQTVRPQAMTENVEQFLARGGVITRIEEHPGPEDRVMLRGRRNRPNPTKDQQLGVRGQHFAFRATASCHTAK